MAVSWLATPRTAGSWSAATPVMIGEKTPASLIDPVGFLAQPERTRRRQAPAHNPRIHFIKGKNSFLGDTAVVCPNGTKRTDPASTGAFGRPKLGVSPLGLAQDREKFL